VALPVEELRHRLAAIVLPETFAYAPPAPLPGSAPPDPTLRQKLIEGAFTAAVAFMMACAVALVTVSPQNFLMSSPICIYGYYRVGDALFPLRAARRNLAKLDRRLEEVWRRCQSMADIDAAWVLRADLTALLARQPQALASGRAPRPSPRQRAEAARLARDLPRLETMATAIEAVRTRRDAEMERLLAQRARLVEQIEAKGETPAALPQVPPRGLRAGTQQLLAKA
jgi:hypothetical protein